MENNIGVLLTNIGTPNNPTVSATRRYLKQFLLDHRVVEIPRIIWWPILYGFILPFRAKKSAKLYQKIWTAEGSPLLTYSEKLRKALADALHIPVALGMHYGNPSIACALDELKKQAVKKIIVLPLYPQYSATTTAATFDAVSAALKKWRVIPDIQMITDYADHPLYIQALAESIQTANSQHHSQKLIFSFHGIPKKYVMAGDPYQSRCEKTISLLVEKLNLAERDYLLTYQSRLGKATWLQPYTDKIFQELPEKGITDVSVICPGFAVDCLETLEEIAIRGKEQFFEAGGKKFHYIPALNDEKKHVALLVDIIRNN